MNRLLATIALALLFLPLHAHAVGTGIMPEAVPALQAQLIAHGYLPKTGQTGQMDKSTESALERLRQDAMLPDSPIFAQTALDLMTFGDAPHARHPAAKSVSGHGSAHPADTDPNFNKDIAKLQYDLKTLSFYTGLIDGRSSPATTDAIVRYKISHGMEISPKIDPGFMRQVSEDANPPASQNTTNGAGHTDLPPQPSLPPEDQRPLTNGVPSSASPAPVSPASDPLSIPATPKT